MQLTHSHSVQIVNLKAILNKHQQSNRSCYGLTLKRNLCFRVGWKINGSNIMVVYMLCSAILQTANVCSITWKTQPKSYLTQINTAGSTIYIVLCLSTLHQPNASHEGRDG